jgi:hypothetical protein
VNATKLMILAAAVAFAAVAALSTSLSAAEKPAAKTAAPAKEPVLTIGRAMLLADYGGGKVCRIDKAGNVTWEMPAPGTQDIWMLPDGSILYSYNKGVRIATPDKTVVWEYKTDPKSEIHACQPLPAGKVVWQIIENELPGNPLRFIGGLRMAANGNLIVANWGGHGHIGQQPQVFEVTHDRQKKVVGVIHDDKHFKTISGMFILDDPAKADKWPVAPGLFASASRILRLKPEA